MRTLTGRWMIKDYCFFHIIKVEYTENEKTYWGKASETDLITLKLIIVNEKIHD
jgi:hypothetical protein